MTTIITRLYRTPDEAEAARDALGAEGCPSGAVSLLASSPDAGGSDLAAIRRAGVYESAAIVYAGHVAEGAALLVVRAPFGTAFRTLEILEDFPDVDVGISHPDAYVESQASGRHSKNGEAALLNSDLLLLSEDLMPPALLKNGWTFSHLFGLPLLTNWMPTGGSLVTGRTTISSYLGLPLLTKRQSPRAGLLKSETPFSSALGLPTLSDDSNKRV